MLRQCAGHELTCLCLESTTDHLVAFSSELASCFGLRTISLKTTIGSTRASAYDADRIRSRINDVDLVCTTAFHQSEVAAIVGDVKPLVVVSVHPALRAALRERLERPLTVVAADPLFADRIRAFASELTRQPETLDVTLAHEADLDALPAETLYTRAARRQLGLAEYHLLAGDLPFIGPDAARAICEIMVELARTAE
ncbi:MAG: hypothetical protein ACT443_02835 [Gemmatimonadota bacterium]